MKIFCVRIGNKYGPEYERYLEEKLPEYDIVWIREAYDPRVMLQWNKMLPMSMDISEPVCVMDIDLLLMNEYRDIFEYPLSAGEFLAMPDWWGMAHARNGYSINGGFFKYHPKDCIEIYNDFMKDIDKWQGHYIKNGVTIGPVNGEQNFVEDHVKKYLDLKLLPNEWFARWSTSQSLEYVNNTPQSGYVEYDDWQYWMNKRYMEVTGNDYLYLGGEFHDDIKMVHFAHSMNKPHEWEDVGEFHVYK